MFNKILILKNDRTGDLFVSLRAINRILNKHKKDKIEIFLSDINHKFNFLFPSINKKVFSMNLSIFEKFKIFFYLLIKNIDTVYILTPKNFYYYLPFFFRNTKFYGISIKSNRNRPNKFLLNRLYKFVVIDRLNLKKRNSSYLIQESLIEKTNDTNNLIENSSITHNFKYPDKYVFFHYKHGLFGKLLEWDLDTVVLLINFLNKNFDNVLFSSEIFNEKINKFFSKKFNTFDFKSKKSCFINERKIIFLKNIDGYDLFHAVKKSTKVICPEGIISHMSYYLKKDLLTLMHFNLKNKQDFINQVISCKEWFPPNNYNFCVLKKNYQDSIKKIEKRI